MFRSHEFKTVIDGVPRVIVSQQAAADMWHLVDEVGTEVGWLGSAERLPSGDFRINHIYLIEQQVSGGTTEISPAGISALAMDLLEQPGGDQEIDRLRFWGHSHVRMGTSPSSQDDQQVQTFREGGCDWFIRGIFNKMRRAQFDIYLFSWGLTCLDVEWEVEAEENTDRRTHWKDEIAEKVSAITYSAPIQPWPHNAYQHRPYLGNGVNSFDDIDDIDDQAVINLALEKEFADELDQRDGEQPDAYIQRIAKHIGTHHD